MGNDNLNVEKLNKIFVDKYADYVELMQHAGCTRDEVMTKTNVITHYDSLSTEEKANVVKDDLSFLNFFTNGGIVISDDNNNKLYEGVNKEIAHSVICAKAPISKNTVFPQEYEEELDGPVTLYKVKDMISQDISLVFPDVKKLFFLGESEEFHKRMRKVFNESDIERFSDIVDASVIRDNEAGVYEYMDLIEQAIRKTDNLDFTEKSKNLS